MGRILCIIGLALCVACGGGSSTDQTTSGGSDAGTGHSPASVNGTIGGQSMAAKDAISGVFSIQSGSVGMVLITTIANTCSQFSGGHGAKSAQAISAGIAYA